MQILASPELSGRMKAAAGARGGRQRTRTTYLLPRLHPPQIQQKNADIRDSSNLFLNDGLPTILDKLVADLNIIELLLDLNTRQ